MNSYIKKTQIQVHPDMKLSAQFTSNMKCFLNTLALKIINTANIVNDKKTVTSRDIQTAVRLVVVGELAKHAVREAVKSITKYNSTNPGTKEKPITAASRAGLVFSPSLFEKMIRNNTTKHVGEASPIYLAAVIEYMCAELIELAGNSCRDSRKIIMMPRDLMLVIAGDIEIQELSNDINFVVIGGGVVPNIHSSFLPSVDDKTKRMVTVGDVKKYVSLPGTESLKEIRETQKGVDLLLQHAPFQHSFKSYSQDPQEPLRISADVYTMLQYVIESKVINILKRATDLVVYNGREKVTGEDIMFVCSLSDINIKQAYHSDNTITITNPGLERLGRRAGVKTFDHSNVINYYIASRGIIGYYMQKIMGLCENVAASLKLKTITMKVLVTALRTIDIIVPDDLVITKKRKVNPVTGSEGSVSSEEAEEEAEEEEDEEEEEAEEEASLE